MTGKIMLDNNNNNNNDEINWWGCETIKNIAAEVSLC
jgi:hypothetical protein